MCTSCYQIRILNLTLFIILLPLLINLQTLRDTLFLQALIVEENLTNAQNFAFVIARLFCHTLRYLLARITLLYMF